MDLLRNRLVDLRQKRGLKQQELAQRAGITRQSLSSLETGRSVPSTAVALHLAQVLECRVEDLFRLQEDSSTLTVELAVPAHQPPGVPSRRPKDDHGRHRSGPTGGERVAVVSVGDRWVAHVLEPDAPAAQLMTADGILADKLPRQIQGGGPVPAKVKLLRDRDELRGSLLCVGCAPALGVLASRAAARSPLQRVLWLEGSSSYALEILRRGQAHVAGAHLLDEESGEYNVPFVRRLLPDRSMLVFNLARWEAGLLMAPGNPLRLKRVEDLVRPDLSVVPRDSGAGAQKLLERALRRVGIPAGAIRTRGPVARGHADVARAVAWGGADAGVAIRSAALAYGLGFIPLAEERFDLVVAEELSDDPRLVRLLDTLSSRRFRRELTSLGGYQTRQTGSLIARTEVS